MNEKHKPYSQEAYRRGRARIQPLEGGRSWQAVGKRNHFYQVGDNTLDPIDSLCCCICYLAHDSKTVYIFHIRTDSLCF